MKYVYSFSQDKAEGASVQKELLGNKGANLHTMSGLGLPVPPGFTISAEVCQYVNAHGHHPETLESEVEQALQRLEAVTKKRFGVADHPLLVSVRSGAAVSMPGMMDTVLDLGLNEQTLQALIAQSGDERFGWDAYRRLIQMFGNVVRGIEHDHFDAALEAYKQTKGVRLDTELDATALRCVAGIFEEIYQNEQGRPFPQDPRAQLWAAIDAVFRSWNTPRAIKYRQINAIPDDVLGTAVNVQTMVFGNMGADSASGVGFTRNPVSGVPGAYGEFLLNAQGEDVVAGIRTPLPLDELSQRMPGVYARLLEVFSLLETHFRDVQDVEFTVERGRLYLLQTRNAKRTAKAAVRIAVDLVGEGTLSQHEALQRVDPERLGQLLHPSFESTPPQTALATGLAASPGAGVGQAVFSAAAAEDWAKRGKTVILVRHETSPDDIGGMQAAAGILTSRGGFTSHAAIVARAMGKPCISGCEALEVQTDQRRFSVNGQTVKEGDWISIDGTSGHVFSGRRTLVESQLDETVNTLLGWADAVRTLGVRANADTPQDARRALALGAEGIGLARTEHMFFEPERLRLFQEIIILPDPDRRARLLDQLRAFQQADFEALLQTMDDKPVIIRLLDPPLHEFLPKTEQELNVLAKTFAMPTETLRQRVGALHEFNPMLGHRGCRLGITHPSIYRMQIEAIVQAAAALKRAGGHPRPRLMVPLVASEGEIKHLREAIEKILAQADTAGVDIKMGTMIELPRACVVADKIAKYATFFSFGTNDLTQMTWGLSRDDAESFLPAYQQQSVLKDDPFLTLDGQGVVPLMDMAVRKGRAARPELGIGICGEHGGDPRSIHLCQRLGLDYVSASPYRVPVARLAAAQAALEAGDLRPLDLTGQEEVRA